MLLSYSKPTFWLRECQCSYAFCPFDALDVALRFIFNVVDYNVVSRRIDNFVLIVEEDIVLNISFQSGDELWN